MASQEWLLRSPLPPAERRPFPWESPPDPIEIAHEVFQAWLTFALFDHDEHQVRSGPELGGDVGAGLPELGQEAGVEQPDHVARVSSHDLQGRDRDLPAVSRV